MAKIQNLAVLGMYSHISVPITFHVYQGNMSPLRVEQPILLSKNNDRLEYLGAWG